MQRCSMGISKAVNKYERRKFTCKTWQFSNVLFPPCKSSESEFKWTKECLKEYNSLSDNVILHYNNAWLLSDCLCKILFEVRPPYNMKFPNIRKVNMVPTNFRRFRVILNPQISNHVVYSLPKCYLSSWESKIMHSNSSRISFHF